jgi:hypothetical protein
MNLSEYLKKYNEENAIVDLKPDQLNNAGGLILRIKIGNAMESVAIPKGEFVPLDQNGETYNILLNDSVISRIQSAILKAKGNNSQYTSFAEAISSFKGQKIKVYLNKAEIYYNTDTGALNFR